MTYWLYFALFALLSGAIFFVMLGSRLRSDTANTGKPVLVLVAILVPLFSLVAYHQRGASDEVALLEAMQGMNAEALSDAAAIEIQQDIQQRLEVITDAKPDKGEYWFLLGGLLVEQENFEGAANAYKEALRIFPGDTRIQSSLAEVQFIVDEYRLTDAVRGYIDTVLAADPYDTTVLGILGISAYRAGQFEAAIQFWERSLEKLPPMSTAAQSIRGSIAQTRQFLDSDTVGAQQKNSKTDATVFINLNVSLAESIRANPDNIVFVFAREFAGTSGAAGMPIAVERLNVAQLPISLRLDDSKVMIPGRRLSDFTELELVARLSYSGQPTAQAEDYEVVIGPVKVADINETSEPLVLEIRNKIED